MDVTISGWVYLPMDQLSNVHIENMKRELTIYPKMTTDISGAKAPDPIFMFHEDFDGNRFGIPRWFYLQNASGSHNEILDITHGNEMLDLETKWRPVGPYAEQEHSTAALYHALTQNGWGGAILNAGCGTGKTVVALEVARRLKRQTLVFCHKEFLVDQWEERILDMMPDARIGRVKQKKCDYKDKDFVLALMQSLAREDGTRYPKEFYESTFGTVIGDELRRSGSQTWSRILPMFKSAYRIGLDATLRRADGAENAFWYHISDVTYRATSESMVPKLRWIRSATTLHDIRRGRYSVRKEKLNSAQLLSQVAMDRMRNDAIIDQILRSTRAGRKTIVMSERLEQLKYLADSVLNRLFSMDLPFEATVGYYTGEWFTGEVYEKGTRGHRRGEPKKKKRSNEELEKAKEANVVFATKQMVQDALDISALDVIIFATPIGDPEQATGRIRRWCLPAEKKCNRYCRWRAGKCTGKPDPVVVDIDDYKIGPLIGKRRKRERFYEEIGAE